MAHDNDGNNFVAHDEDNGSDSHSAYDEDYGRNNSGFEQIYRCYPVSLIDKQHLEKGDKIVMPASALDRLMSDFQVEYPMLFQLSNPSPVAAGRVTHCGVLEFVADEGLIYLPFWMMKNMLLQEGDLVELKNKRLEKGKFVKLQPHTKDFLDNISDPKAVLETTLRNYTCLTAGDTFMVDYNDKKYYINVIETKPSPAICVVDTDCEVDFAPPLDYVEPKPAEKKPSKKRAHSTQEGEEEPPQKKEKLFSPFTGSAQRLDGKPVSSQLESTEMNGTNCKGTSKSASSTSASKSVSQGKIVFGSNGIQPANETRKVAPKKSRQESSDQKKAEEQPKLQAFTGKKYTLNG